MFGNVVVAIMQCVQCTTNQGLTCGTVGRGMDALLQPRTYGSRGGGGPEAVHWAHVERSRSRAGEDGYDAWHGRPSASALSGFSIIAYTGVLVRSAAVQVEGSVARREVEG